MEPPNPPADPSVLSDWAFWALSALGAIVGGILHKSGKTARAEPPQSLSLSGALMDNRAVDPLVQKLDASTLAIERLCDIMEEEVSLRRSHVEEERRAEERKAMALSIADQVREDILQEMRNEIHKNEPAKMPPVRKAPRQSE